MEALSFYEKAASIMQWLECTPDDIIKKMKQLPKLVKAAEGKANVGIEIEQAKEDKPKTKEEQYDDHLSELMLTNFNDNNVKLCSGPLTLENGDKEIHDNILFTLYSSMSMCYMQLGNITEARKAIAAMETIAKETSVFNFRKAQVIYADKTSSVEELETALDCILKGKQLKANEKIFEHNVNILRMFNLQNHDTIFD